MASKKEFENDYIHSKHLHDMLNDAYVEMCEMSDELVTGDGQDHAEHILSIMSVLLSFSEHSIKDLEDQSLQGEY